jgi:hypothetical protein
MKIFHRLDVQVTWPQITWLTRTSMSRGPHGERAAQ